MMTSTTELVLRACDGEDRAFAALAERYASLINRITARYYLVGADRDDLHQEALIGLHNACLSFDCSGRAQFTTFAALCVERHVITALKTAQRGKHRSLNDSARFETPLDDETGRTLADLIASPGSDPASIAEQRATLRLIVEDLPASLSAIEQTVLSRILGGATLKEAGYGLGRPGKADKTADNALQRVRRKTQLLLVA